MIRDDGKNAFHTRLIRLRRVCTQDPKTQSWMRIILGGVDIVDEGRHPANDKRIGDERRSRQLFDVFMKYDFVDMSEAYVDWIDLWDNCSGFFGQD